jgi:transcription antitermination protein NusB
MRIRTETRIRALALQLLYAWDQVGADRDDVRPLWAAICAARGATPRTEERALDLAEAVVRDRGRLDGALRLAAENWRLERLAVVDRNVLRLAMAEMERGETPVKVVIDEAIRLARWFGAARSPAFVNGILDRVARERGWL